MTSAALWTKQRSLARTIAAIYHIPGCDRQDVEQEALIALWEASRTYRDDEGTTFETFAALVIRRRLLDCVKAANRIKHKQLTLAARVQQDDDGDVTAIVEQLPHLHQVTDHVEDRERLQAVLAAMRTLTQLERRCIVGIASGSTYKDLGPKKMVDNAVARGRKKLRAAA